MKRTVEYLGKSEDGFAEYEISESYEDDETSKVYKPEKIPRPKESQSEPTSNKGFLKLNKEEFLKTEFGGQLRCTVDRLHYLYENRTECANLEDWEELHSCCCRINELLTGLGVFILAIKHFYGIKYNFRRTAYHYGLCTTDGSDWLFKVNREIDGKGE